MSENRRDFLKRAALAAAASTLPAAVSATPAGAASAASAASAPPTTFDAGLLSALGDAVLPESLGAPSRAHAVRDFAAWAAAYRPVSEEMHGYGDQEITYTAADPSPGWRSQLAALELLARRKHRKGFATITVEQRRALVRPQLPRGRGLRLSSNIVSAPHIAIALLAHWAASSAATDLAYGVVIGKDQCRVLADAPRRPLPLSEPRGQ
ncbi:MAG: hypothetical protein NTU67_02700 [Gemmatimonadetes bacterium]|nr:hypothetical protein [Gemmatimonadota bacterium]